MKTRLWGTALIVLLAGGLAAGQSHMGRTHGAREHRSVFGPFSLNPVAGFRSHVGIFPVFGFPRETAAGFLINDVLFGDYRPTRVGGRALFCYDRYPYPYFYGSGGAYPPVYDRFGWESPGFQDMSFVQEWKDRPPRQIASQPRQAESILLSEGMDEEAIIKAIGSPLQKIKLDDREVWKYSGYSLLLEGGRLKEIR